MTRDMPASRCLFCSRFVKAGVTRCARCDSRSATIRAELAAARPDVRDGVGVFQGFAVPSGAYLRVRRFAMFGGLLAALATAVAACI